MFKPDQRTVKMIGYARTGERLEPTPQRWKSFLWNVVEDSVQPITD